jgi:hypothetical protein
LVGSGNIKLTTNIKVRKYHHWNAFWMPFNRFQFMKILNVTSALGRDRSKIIKSIVGFFITFSIFPLLKHNLKLEFHYALIQLTNLHLIKSLKTLNLMNFHQNKLNYEEV